jgi:hypothetical protein
MQPRAHKLVHCTTARLGCQHVHIIQDSSSVNVSIEPQPVAMLTPSGCTSRHNQETKHLGGEWYSLRSRPCHVTRWPDLFPAQKKMTPAIRLVRGIQGQDFDISTNYTTWKATLVKPSLKPWIHPSTSSHGPPPEPLLDIPTNRSARSKI